MENRKILVALLGTSPAVLTETVWGLAHQEKPWIPDEIEVVTTATGAKRARELLLTPQLDKHKQTVWETLRAAIQKQTSMASEDLLPLGNASFHILSDAQKNELDDLRTTEENLAAADSMLKLLKESMTSDDTEVYISIAGGRKTMGALLFSCASLLARPQDKIFHVLVNEPFENPRLSPPFFFPTSQKHTLLQGDKIETYSGKKAEIELFEVPFVRMKRFYDNELRRSISYKTLVSEINSVTIELNLLNGICLLNGEDIKLAANEFLAFYFYVTEEALQTCDTCDRNNNILERLCALREKLGQETPKTVSSIPLLNHFFSKCPTPNKNSEANEIGKLFSQVRDKLKKHLSKEFVEREILPLRDACPKFEKVTVHFTLITDKAKLKILNRFNLHSPRSAE